MSLDDHMQINLNPEQLQTPIYNIMFFDILVKGLFFKQIEILVSWEHDEMSSWECSLQIWNPLARKMIPLCIDSGLEQFEYSIYNRFIN